MKILYLMMGDEKLKRKERRIKTTVFVVAVVVIGLWILTYFLLKDWSPEARGTFGDMFGSVNALFSGLALTGVVFSIVLQQIELGYQREELKATRGEFTMQNETMKKQRFENTFFSLTKLYQDTVNNLVYVESTYEYKGLNGMKKLFERLTRVLVDGIKLVRPGSTNLTFDNLKTEEIKKIVFEQYQVFLGHNQSYVSHYFRTIENVLRFIDQSDALSDKAEREFYATLFIDQISHNELVLLFYQIYTGSNTIDLLTLEKKYRILRNLNDSRLIPKSHYVIREEL